MKVTFTCEKCGFVQGVCSTCPGRSLGETVREFIGDGFNPCPNCAKLSYGPLTEELLAEFLWAATGATAPMPMTSHRRRQANRVLRLLHAVHNSWDGWGGPEDLRESHDWRRELLDLAQ